MPGCFEHPLMIGDFLVMGNAVVLGQRDDDKPSSSQPVGKHVSTGQACVIVLHVQARWPG